MSPAHDEGWPADAIEVGCVLDAWGVKGWIKVQPFSNDPQALFSSRRWFIKPPDLSLNTMPQRLDIAEAREHGELVVARMLDVTDRAAAQALRGARVFVGRASFPTADPDEYYWVDLIGLAVVNRQGQALGTVGGLIDTGAHSVLRVASADDAPERLIPFVAPYVDDVNLPERRITVDWGLDY